MLNPVLRREAKTSLRNWKIFYAVAGYILIVTAVAAIAIWQLMYNSYYASFDPSEMVNVYIGLTVLQLVLVLLVTPAFTAGSISGERERQTLDLLLVTKMSPFSIVTGKFLSGLSIIVLMVVARNKRAIYCSCYRIYASHMRSIWSGFNILFNNI